MPNALPRSFGSVNVVVSSDSADGTRIAPNAPWQARAVTSMAKLTEAPPTAETPAKPARPVRNITLRPNRSASRPPNSSRLPNASEYAVTTHCLSTVGEVQRALRRRQRDVHHRGVEHDHQLRERDHHQDQPAPRVRRRG